MSGHLVVYYMKYSPIHSCKEQALHLMNCTCSCHPIEILNFLFCVFFMQIDTIFVYEFLLSTTRARDMPVHSQHTFPPRVPTLQNCDCFFPSLKCWLLVLEMMLKPIISVLSMHGVAYSPVYFL